MNSANAKPFGVIEGFYGDPWTTKERAACIDLLAENGGNTYVWAPKSEPRHRDRWSEPFSSHELDGFATLIERSEKVTVSIGLTPGSEATVDDVIRKLRPVVSLGCRVLTICFDDLPVLRAGQRHREIANGVREALDVDVWLVPTHYAGTSGSAYLTELVSGLDPNILVMWTGSMVVNEAISEENLSDRAAVMEGRSPLIWDNTPVNDAMMSGYMHMGPYVGRSTALRTESAGVLCNPMVSMQASIPTIESACGWWRGENPVDAWSRAVERLGWRAFAEATAFPGDSHWPGDRPSRAWLTEVAGLDALDDPEVDPWIESAREGARLCLVALDVIDARAGGARAGDLAREIVTLTGVSAWLRRPARTLGAGPRVRPMFTQDDRGRFAPTGATIVRAVSIVETCVNAALRSLGSP